MSKNNAMDEWTTFKEMGRDIIIGPDVDSNMTVNAMSNIRKYTRAGENYGLSLIALSVLDQAHDSLEMTVKFNDEIYIRDTAMQLIGIWSKYKPLPSFIRSCKIDGKFVEYMEDIKLQYQNNHPSSSDEFHGKKFIIDIEISGTNMYKFKLYKYGEMKPRILTISVKTE